MKYFSTRGHLSERSFEDVSHTVCYLRADLTIRGRLSLPALHPTAGSTFPKTSQLSQKTGNLNGLVFPTNSLPSTSSRSSSPPMSFLQPISLRSSTKHTLLARPRFAIRPSHPLFNSIPKHTYSNCSTGPPMHSRTLRFSSLGIFSNTSSIDAIPANLPESHQRSLLLSVRPAVTLAVLPYTAFATKPTYPSSFSSLRVEYHQYRKLK